MHKALSMALVGLWFVVDFSRSRSRTSCDTTLASTSRAARASRPTRSWRKRIACFSCAATRVTRDARCRRSEKASRRRSASERRCARPPRPHCNRKHRNNETIQRNHTNNFHIIIWYSVLFFIEYYWLSPSCLDISKQKSTLNSQKKMNSKNKIIFH